MPMTHTDNTQPDWCLPELDDWLPIQSNSFEDLFHSEPDVTINATVGQFNSHDALPGFYSGPQLSANDGLVQADAWPLIDSLHGGQNQYADAAGASPTNRDPFSRRYNAAGLELHTDHIQPFADTLHTEASAPTQTFDEAMLSSRHAANTIHGLVTCSHIDRRSDCGSRCHISESAYSLSLGFNLGQDLSPLTAKKTTEDSAPSKAQNGEKAKATRHRTNISAPAKTILDAAFQENAYPSQDEVSLLVKETGLESRVVKNWFTNARSRKKVPDCELPASHCHQKG